MGSGQQIILLFQDMQDAGKRLLTTLIGLDYYPQSSNFLKSNEILK